MRPLFQTGALVSQHAEIQIKFLSVLLWESLAQTDWIDASWEQKPAFVRRTFINFQPVEGCQNLAENLISFSLLTANGEIRKWLLRKIQKK